RDGVKVSDGLSLDIQEAALEVRGDELSLINAFYNVIHNAQEVIRTIPSAQVLVTLRREGNHAVIEIANPGPAIDAALLEPSKDRLKIFELGASSKGKGRGLGMAETWHVIKDHQGAIEIRSVPEQGSHFTITLPLLEGAEHHYVTATDEEKARVFEDIIRSTAQGIEEYGIRFLRGVEASRPLVPIGFPSQAEWRAAETARIQGESYHLSPQRVFHSGLLRDEKGIYWIVKKKEQRLEDEGATKNHSERERLAYLLAQGRANLTEIRLLTAVEAQSLGLNDAWDAYLSRVVTSKNYSADALPHQNYAQAYSGLFVANILMRKYDPHLLNVGRVGGAPVALDHDGVFLSEIYANQSDEGFRQFVSDFLLHSLIKTTERLKPSDPKLVFMDDLVAVQEMARQGQRYDGWRVIKGMAEDLGLGAGYLKAEGLTQENIRQSILDFKSVGNVKVLAEQAGYRNEALATVIQFIEENQKNLGRDVDFVWMCITGQSGRFIELDQLARSEQRPLSQFRQDGQGSIRSEVRAPVYQRQDGAGPTGQWKDPSGLKNSLASLPRYPVEAVVTFLTSLREAVERGELSFEAMNVIDEISLKDFLDKFPKAKQTEEVRAAFDRLKKAVYPDYFDALMFERFGASFEYLGKLIALRYQAKYQGEPLLRAEVPFARAMIAHPFLEEAADYIHKAVGVLTLDTFPQELALNIKGLYDLYFGFSAEVMVEFLINEFKARQILMMAARFIEKLERKNSQKQTQPGSLNPVEPARSKDQSLRSSGRKPQSEGGRSEVRAAGRNTASAETGLMTGDSWLTDPEKTDWSRRTSSQIRFLIQLWSQNSGLSLDELVALPEAEAARLFTETVITDLSAKTPYTLEKLYRYYETLKAEKGSALSTLEFLLNRNKIRYQGQEQAAERLELEKYIGVSDRRSFDQISEELNLDAWMHLFNTDQGQAALFYLLAKRHPEFKAEALLAMISEKFLDYEKQEEKPFSRETLMSPEMEKALTQYWVGLAPERLTASELEEIQNVLFRQILIRIYNPLLSEALQLPADSSAKTVAEKALDLADVWFRERLNAAEHPVPDHLRQVYERIQSEYAAMRAENYQRHVHFKNGNGSARGIPSSELLLHQIAGVYFARHQNNGRVILGDEMGVGKTLQALMTAQDAKAQKIVIIAPNTLLANWEKEIKKWIGPETAVEVIGKKGGNRVRRLETAVQSGVRFVLVSQEALGGATMGPRLVDTLNGWKPDFIIGDEIHRLRNMRSKRTKQFARLDKSGASAVYLSGTTVVNGAADLFVALNAVDPVRFNDFDEFVKTIADDPVAMAHLNIELNQKYFLRRTLEQVMGNLPKKHAMEVIPVALDVAQKKALQDEESQHENRKGVRGSWAHFERQKQILIDLELLKG
ncbi:MAG: DEAD/DEAH box helicase family protein, partial [Candidatus Omnitrophica bacterium]|nr:DEAD/DEAH box helicase family protein [Candidatus Omnitrophota bacterium]